MNMLSYQNAALVPERLPDQRQRGVALMIVILVFALVSILAVGMYNRQSLFVQSSANTFAQAQAYQFALGAEILGRIYLKDDWDSDEKDKKFVDDLEFVAQSIALPYEQGLLEAQYNDMHGKLNINDLVNLDGTVNTLMTERFKRLLKRLALDAVKVEVIHDWLAERQGSGSFEGAEDGYYLGLEVPYRTALQPIYDPSELFLLKEIGQKELQALSPHVSVLPRGLAPINVNTATEVVLQSLVENLSDQEAKDLVTKREEGPWETVADFLAEPVLKGKKIDDTYIAVNSVFFEIATRVTVADRKVRLRSLIYRKPEDGKMTVVKRDQGQKGLINKEAGTL